jgi:hypothetical protein
MNPQSMRFIHHSGTIDSASLEDLTERNLIAKLVVSLHNDVQVDDIAVICRSWHQRRCLKNYLAGQGFKHVRVLESALDDACGDNDVFILCAVHETEEAAESSDAALQEVNAALSRARQLVLLVGNGERILSSSQRTKWLHLFEVLKDRRAIDGFNYIEERFDASCVAVPDGSGTAMNIRLIPPSPRKSSDLNELRQIDCLIDRNTHKALDVHDYVRKRHLFVGTVGYRSVSGTGNEGASYFVLNRNCSGLEVALDVHCSAGVLSPLLVPGETIGLHIDEYRAEQSTVSASHCGYLCAPLAPQHATGAPELSCGSRVLANYDMIALRPKGLLAAYLYFPVFPPVQLKITAVDNVRNKAWAVAASLGAFLPALPCVLPHPRCPPVGSELIGNLKRVTSDGTLVYDVLLPEQTRQYGNGVVGAGSVPELPGGVPRAALSTVSLKTPSFNPVDAESYLSISVQDVHQGCMFLTVQLPYWAPMLRRNDIECAYDVCFRRPTIPQLFSGDHVLRHGVKELGFIPLFQVTVSLEFIEGAWRLTDKRIFLCLAESFVRASSATRSVSSAVQRAELILRDLVLGIETPARVSGRGPLVTDPWACLIGLVAAEGMLAFRPLESVLICQHASLESFDPPKWFVPQTPDNKLIQLEGLYGPCSAVQQPMALISGGTTRFPDLLAQNALAAAITNTSMQPNQRLVFTRLVERINSASSLLGLSGV